MKRKFQNSDIPYAQRLLMQKRQTIAEHRNDAASVALRVACVALNDTEGLGYARLCRFARHLGGLLKEYYEDPEVGEAHLETRLRQMGFIVKDGHVFAVEESGTGKVVPAKLMEDNNAD